MIDYNMENLKKLKTMGELVPEAMKAFQAFDAAALAEGAIPAKYKALTAVAVAITTQCVYCIEVHVGRAQRLGCTEQELVEAVMVSAALRSGASITHGTHALRSAPSAVRG